MMPKSTLICFWWLESRGFKIGIEFLDLSVKIAVIKILIFIAIKSTNVNQVVRITAKSLLLSQNVLDSSLKWLDENGTIVILSYNNSNEKNEYIIKYTDQENIRRTLFEDCFVELPDFKILNFIRKTPNDQEVTYEALSNYLMMIKGFKQNSLNIKQLFYDEEYLKGNYVGTWREVLVEYDLVEFLEVDYVGIY